MKISRLRQFEEHVHHWRKVFALTDWEINCEYARLLSRLAQVDIDDEARKADIFLNKKNNTEENLNETAFHEICHVLLRPLTKPLEQYFSGEFIGGLEHGIINKLWDAFKR